MQIGNKFRCYPTLQQSQILLRWIGCQRYIYNSKVREDQHLRRSLLQSPIDQKYAQFKTDLTPWLSEVPSIVLRNGAVVWKSAYARYFSKLGGRPVIHKKCGKQSVWLTSELFEFIPVLDVVTGEVASYKLHIGTPKFPVGTLEFNAHREYKIPASIHISIYAGRWYVSFNYDNDIPEPSDTDTLEWLMQFGETELRQVTVGLDRGVALPLAGSDGQRFELTGIQKKRIAKQEKYKKRWQRRLARCTKGSAGRAKAVRKVARYQRYATDTRRDLAHKTSYALATDPAYKLYVFEALKIKNMTKRAKPKQDENGKWIRNGRRAKSGLNKSILASAWGQTKTYLQYKARRQGKLTIEVPAFYSSQECSHCGFTHPENRKTQTEFICQSCGHTDNADHNAAKVIAMRGVKLLLSGEYVEKKKKRCGLTRTKVGAGRSELTEEIQSTPGEIQISRMSGNTHMRESLTLETPATCPLGL